MVKVRESAACELRLHKQTCQKLHCVVSRKPHILT